MKKVGKLLNYFNGGIDKFESRISKVSHYLETGEETDPKAKKNIDSQK